MKISINGLHIFALVAPATLFFTDLPAPLVAYAICAMLFLGGAIVTTRFLEKIELAKKAEEESRITETKELLRLVENYDVFCRKLGAAAKEKGLAVVFDDEVYDNPEYTDSVWVIGSGCKVTQSIPGQMVTLAPMSNNGCYFSAIDPDKYWRGRNSFNCYPAIDGTPKTALGVKQ
jgi:hypothetical protein